MPLDIAAFSFAGGGAMGEHCGVYIITTDSIIYHLNYGDGTWEDEDQLNALLPVLKDTHFHIFGGGDTVDPWYVEGLGMGNYLVLKNCMKAPMEEMKQKYSKLLEEKILYNVWDDFVLEILQTGLAFGKDEPSK